MDAVTVKTQEPKLSLPEAVLVPLTAEKVGAAAVPLTVKVVDDVVPKAGTPEE